MVNAEENERKRGRAHPSHFHRETKYDGGVRAAGLLTAGKTPLSTEAQQSFLPDTPTSWLPGYPTLPLELFTLGFSFTILGAQSLVLCCGSLQRHLPHCGVGLPLYQEIFISSSFTLGVPQVHWLSDSFP